MDSLDSIGDLVSEHEQLYVIIEGLPLDYESLASLISNKFKLFPFAESVFYTKYDFSSTRFSITT